MIITNWVARRAGARITITGQDSQGKVVKITGVDRIDAPGRGHAQPTATDKAGDRHILA